MKIQSKEVEDLLQKYDKKIEQFRTTTDLAKRIYLEERKRFFRKSKISGAAIVIGVSGLTIAFGTEFFLVFALGLIPELCYLAYEGTKLEGLEDSYKHEFKRLRYLIDNKENYESFIRKSIEDTDNYVDNIEQIEKSIEREQKVDSELDRKYVKTLK